MNYFLGDIENAIDIQIWCALIALMILQVLHKENKAILAFNTLTAIARLHLMNYINMKSIIKKYKPKKERAIKKPAEKPPKMSRILMYARTTILSIHYTFTLVIESIGDYIGQQ
ncbi:MAG: hypothetical protein H7320_14935 [Ferruginibacter sp.]|nr:hypothetical protein [Ferruginibacter sp.]